VGIRMRVGIRRRVENSVGCLSEKRLFIRSGNNVDEWSERSCRPALDKYRVDGYGGYIGCGESFKTE